MKEDNISTQVVNSDFTSEKCESIVPKRRLNRKNTFQVKHIKEKATVKAKNIGKNLLILALVLSTILMFAIAARYYIKYNNLLDETNSHRVTITNVIVEEKLKEIEELATYSFEYTGVKTQSELRDFFGKKLKFTKNTVSLSYTGVIKVGYDVSSIKPILKNDSTVCFILPNSKVLDNYIVMDKLKCTEENNIFNPISSAQLLTYFDGIKDEELLRAEKKGIYSLAEKHLKTIITNFFSEYNVEFIDVPV